MTVLPSPLPTADAGAESTPSASSARLRGWGGASRAALCFALGAHVLILEWLYLGPGYRADLSTMTADFARGMSLLSGRLLYRDFGFEYPPLAALFYAAPALVARTVAGYRAAFALQMGVIDLLVVGVTWLWLRRRGLNPSAALAAQAVFLLAAGVMIVLERFDLAAAGLTLLALHLWPRAGGKWSWLCLGLGAGLKLYPAVIAPLLIVDHARRREWRALAVGLGLFAIVLILPLLPFLVVAPDSLSQFLVYHAQRGLQIESLLATPVLLSKLAGAAVRSFFAFGSQEVGSAWSDTLSALALPLVALSLLVVTWRYAVQATDDERRLRYATAAVLAFAVFNKVLSAQYLIWLYPLVPLVVVHRRVVWPLYGAALCLTQYLYPHGWNQLTALRPEAIGIQALRNGLLLLLWGALMWEPEARRAARRLSGLFRSYRVRSEGAGTEV